MFMRGLSEATAVMKLQFGINIDNDETHYMSTTSYTKECQVQI